MNINLLNGMSYDQGIFNSHGGTNEVARDLKIREDLKILLTQERGKFYPDPEFGSDLQQFMFEPITQELGKQIQSEVASLVETYYPQLSLVGVDVNMNEINHEISISIKYRYLDNYQEVSTLNINLTNKTEM